MKLNRLNPIRDNLKTLLSPKSRLEDIDLLQRQVEANTFKTTSLGSGIGFSMRFDAPKRAADQLEQLSGEVEIVSYSTRCIEVKDLREKSGEFIKHPLLKDLTIYPRIKDGEYSRIELELGGNRARLLNWTVWATVKSLSIAMRSPVCQFHKARISVWFGCLVECVCVRVFCASFGLRDWYETAKLSL